MSGYAGFILMIVLTIIPWTYVPVAAQEPPSIPPDPATKVPQPLEIPRQTPSPLPRLSDIVEITADEAELEGNILRAKNVRVAVGEYTLLGGRVEGDIEKELLFTDNASLTFRGQRIVGDAIRFSLKSKAFRVENLHTSLSPEFLQGYLLSPLYLSAGTIQGQRNRPLIGEDIDATTCERPRPDYLLRAGEVKVEQGKRIILRRATFILWGKRLFTLPTLIIPLDQRPRSLRTDYLPNFGRTQEEGWFVKSALSYLLADRVPGLLHLDVMEKKGLGTGFEQAWNLAKSAGTLTFYAIPTGGTNRNLSGHLNNRLSLGGGQFLTTENSFQQNSFLALPNTTSFNTRLGYTRIEEGLSTTLHIGRNAIDSAGSTSRSYTLNLAQDWQYSSFGRMGLTADYSRYSTSGPGFSQRTEQLSTRFNASHRSDNFILELTANKNIPIGQRLAQSFFSGVEKLPEITLSQFRFTRGTLSQIPATFSLSVGKYSEGSTAFGSGAARTTTERVVAGFDIANIRYRLSPSTGLNISAGFQQYFYGEGAAQYVVRNTAQLTQRWNKRSGLNLSYHYQRPEGGTPFLFDRLGQFHTLHADIGFLDDRRLQLTARVGYDFAQRGFGGFRQPWQTLSANLLLRPIEWARLRNLITFDPNTGKLLFVTTDLRLRGHNEFALDLVARYDPRQRKVGNLNGYFNLPIGNLWRVIALFQYNGFLNRFESRNLQIIRDFHCLEASLTYMENPFGFRSDRQIFFQLRIKAFPIFQRFGIGQFGQVIDTSIGEAY